MIYCWISKCTLTRRCGVMYIWVSKLGHYRFKEWLAVCSLPSHYLNKCWFVINWIPGNKFRWNLNENEKMFIHKNEFESIACEMAKILSQPQQSGRSPKVVAVFLLQTLVAILYDYFNCMMQSKWNLIFGTKFSSICLAKGEKRLVFGLSFVNLQRAKIGTRMFDATYRCMFVV